MLDTISRFSISYIRYCVKTYCVQGRYWVWEHGGDTDQEPQYHTGDRHALKEQWAEELLARLWWWCAESRGGRGRGSLGEWPSRKCSQDTILVTLDKSLLDTEPQFPCLSHSIHLVRFCECGSCWARVGAQYTPVPPSPHADPLLSSSCLRHNLWELLFCFPQMKHFPPFLQQIAHVSPLYLIQKRFSPQWDCCVSLSQKQPLYWGACLRCCLPCHLWPFTHCWFRFYKYLESDCCRRGTRVLSDSQMNQAHDLLGKFAVWILNHELVLGALKANWMRLEIHYHLFLFHC